MSARQRSERALVDAGIARTPEKIEWPRLALIRSSERRSIEQIAADPALAGWPADSSLVITANTEDKISWQRIPGNAASNEPLDPSNLAAQLKQFDPNVVLIDADVTTPALLAAAEGAHRAGSKLCVRHSSRFPETLEAIWPDRYFFWTTSIARLAKMADLNVADCEELANEISHKYGRSVEILMNTVELDDEPLQRPTRSDSDSAIGRGIRFGYASSLAHHRGGNNIALAALAFASATDDSSLHLRVEARNENWPIVSHLSSLENVTAPAAGAFPAPVDDFLCAIDVLVFSQDFDVAALSAERNALPAEVPELLSAGLPILAIGPAGNKAIEFLRGTGAAIVVDTPEIARISWAIDLLGSSAEQRAALSKAASAAAQRFDAATLIPIFHVRLHELKRGLDQQVVEETHQRSPVLIRANGLDQLRGVHQGQRCVIVGNGPSLRETQLDLLSSEVVLASNAIYLLFADVDWRPSYYTAVDPLFLLERHEEINAMLRDNSEIVGLFPDRVSTHDDSGRIAIGEDLITAGDQRLIFHSLADISASDPFGRFSHDASAGIVQPATVTIALMQLAVHLGFTELVLIGCDTKYSIPNSVRMSGPEIPEGTGEKLVLRSTRDDDPNHFRPDYFGADTTWHHPRVGNMIKHYEATRVVLEALNVKVINATVGGDLEVFPRLSLQEALQQ